jgi:hypothetical protein
MIDEAPPPNRAASEQPPAAAARQFSLRSVFGWPAWFAGLCGVISYAAGVGLEANGVSAGSYGVLAGCVYIYLSWAILAYVSPRWNPGGLGWLLAGLAIIGLLLAMLLPSVRSGPNPRRAACLKNLGQVGVALLRYEGAHGQLPPAFTVDQHGRPMHSWRALILPFFDDTSMAEAYRFDEPWDGPNNRRLANQAPSFYRCPSDLSPSSMTSYVAITGPGTVWGKPLATVPPADQSKTILVIEVGGPNINWLEPRDLDIRQIGKQARSAPPSDISTRHGCAGAVHADASVEWLLPDQLGSAFGALQTTGSPP